MHKGERERSERQVELRSHPRRRQRTGRASCHDWREVNITTVHGHCVCSGGLQRGNNDAAARLGGAAGRPVAITGIFSVCRCLSGGKASRRPPLESGSRTDSGRELGANAEGAGDRARLHRSYRTQLTF